MIQKDSKYQIDKWTTPPEYQLEKKLWDGTNIQVSQRVGDEERMWVRDKLTRLHVAGFLALAEYQARDSAAEVAVTRESLNRLISDLPAHEDDWKSARKVPVDKAVLRQAIEVTAPKKSRFANLFPVPIVLGGAAFIMGVAGVNARPADPLAACAVALAVMGFASIVTGFIWGIRT